MEVKNLKLFFPREHLADIFKTERESDETVKMFL
jgi:hypothetical protein